MPRIDPNQLLSCLKVLLDENGGINSEKEVIRIAGLMSKYSKKLVSKCIYVQILKCTKTELLGEFMSAGGWNLVHTWLCDAISTVNWPLVQEILELLLLCPVDVERLKTNSAPKLVKSLSINGGNEGVVILALKLVEQWLKLVKSTEVRTIEGKLGEVKITDNNRINSESTIPTVKVNVPMTIKTIKPEIYKQMDSNSTTTTNSSEMGEYDDSIITEDEDDDSKDPLAIADESMEAIETINKPMLSQGLVYKMTFKDGKQVFEKMTALSLTKENSDTVKKNKVTDKKLLIRTSVDSEKSDTKSSKDNEKKYNKSSSDLKDNKSVRDKDKSKSSNSSSSSGSNSGSNSNSNKDKSKSSSSSKYSSSSSSNHKSSKSSSSSSSRSKSHRSSSDKSRSDKDHSSSSDKHRSSSGKSSSSSSKDRDRQKDRTSSSSSSNKDKITSDKDTEKLSRERVVDQVEKDKDTLSKVTPLTLDKMPKIPKKPKTEPVVDTLPTKPISKSITIPSKKASISIEVRDEKSSTVKTYKSNFRSHGLTEEAPPPPSRRGLKKPNSVSTPGLSIPTTLSIKRLSPPPNKDTPEIKKAKIAINNLADAIEKPGAIKIIPAKPKLVETNLFADALSAAMVPKKEGRKRKRRTSLTKDGNSPPESPVNSKLSPMKFYQDTLDEERNNSDLNARRAESPNSGNDDDDDIPLKKVKEDIERKESAQEENVEDNEEDDEIKEEVRQPGPGCGPDGPPGVLMIHRRKGPKKKLTWKPQANLEEIRYFELDETERVNVTKTFGDMKQMDMVGERDAMAMVRQQNCNDMMVEQTAWKPLILIDGIKPCAEHGKLSKERIIQADRERTTLKALYFSRALIPDSPSEPDMEHYIINEPAIIPLDDVIGNPEAVSDFSIMPWPEPKGYLTDNYDGNDSPIHIDVQYSTFIPFNSNNVIQSNWQMPSPNSHLQPNAMLNNNKAPNMITPAMNFNNMNMGMRNAGGPLNNANRNCDINPQLLGPNNMNMMNGQPFINNNNNGGSQFGPCGPNFGPMVGMGANNFCGPNMNGNNMRPMGPMGGPNGIQMNGGGNPIGMNGGPMGPNGMQMKRPMGGPMGPMGMGLTNDGPRGNNGGNNNNGGIWKPGNDSNWRPAGPGDGNSNNDRQERNRGKNRNRNDRNDRNRGSGGNWALGNNRVCQQFIRGHCRLGNNCKFVHPNNKNHF